MEELIMDYNHWVLLLIFVMTLICIIAAHRIIKVVYAQKMAKLQKLHENEIAIMEKQFNQKKEWDEIMALRLNKEEDADWIKEKKEMKEHLNELWKERSKVTPLDLKRVTMLHLILCGCKEGIAPENMEKEMEKVKKTYEILKEYLKN